MKPARPDPADQSPLRRSQPVRQARVNPSRGSTANGRGACEPPVGSIAASDQSIGIFPATMHFADAITALPRELVRHFTLLKEVEAKIYAPEKALFRLVAEAIDANLSALPSAADLDQVSVSLHNISNGGSAAVLASTIPTVSTVPIVSTVLQPDSDAMRTIAQDPINLPRRQLFRQMAFNIQEMVVSLEEKNHVIATANDVLRRQTTRIEDVWPYLENEFSDEAKWGSLTHWAYSDNRIGKAAHAERTRREAANAISAAVQAIADEAAARSEARKQAVQAKRNLKTTTQQAEVGEEQQQARGGEASRKAQSQSRARKSASATTATTATPASAAATVSTQAKPTRGTPPVSAAESAPVAGTNGAGSVPSHTTNGNPAKRRKVETIAKNGGPSSMERMASTMLETMSGAARSAKTACLTESPATDTVPNKKRKAAASGSNPVKKGRNGSTSMAPSAAGKPVTSPVYESFVDVKDASLGLLTVATAPRPPSARPRQNSTPSNPDKTRTRPSSSASDQPNELPPGSFVPANWPASASYPATSLQPIDTKSTDNAVLPNGSEVEVMDRLIIITALDPAAVADVGHDCGSSGVSGLGVGPVGAIASSGFTVVPMMQDGRDGQDGVQLDEPDREIALLTPLQSAATIAMPAVTTMPAVPTLPEVTAIPTVPTMPAVSMMPAATTMPTVIKMQTQTATTMPTVTTILTVPTMQMVTTMPTVTTKSGRTSKPSTPKLATFQEALRSRSGRGADGTGPLSTSKRSASRKTATPSSLRTGVENGARTPTTWPGLIKSDENGVLNATSVGAGAQAGVRYTNNGGGTVMDEGGDGVRGADRDDDGEDGDGEGEGDDLRYCYCNGVSYGEMVACDGEGCEREWFHLDCVGLRVAPKGNAKWFCESCKDRLKTGGRKATTK